MNRRQFTKMLACLPILRTLSNWITTPKYGDMDVDRWFKEGHLGKRVLVNGVDVTNVCFRFDDVKGYADCQVLNDNGQPHLNRDMDGIVSERIYGNVEVVG